MAVRAHTKCYQPDNEKKANDEPTPIVYYVTAINLQSNEQTRIYTR